MLTPERVHLIRTSGLTDAHWARLLRITRVTIRYARIGRTWASHPTPPDRRPRTSTGRHSSIEARLKPESEAAVISRALASLPLPSTSMPEHP